MMKTMRAQTIDAPPEPRSPLRQALAEAIQQSAAAERTSKAAAAAVDDARGVYLDGWGARRAAAAALAEAREGGDRLEILNAIEREAETSAAVERLRAARERAEAEVERPAEAVTRAQAQVQAAASTVVRCELERLVRASAEATERAVAALSQLIACADGAARGNLSFDPSAPEGSRFE